MSLMPRGGRYVASGASYTQTPVDTNGTAFLRVNSSGSANAKLTMSVWVADLNSSGNNFKAIINSSSFKIIARNGKYGVRIWDSAGTDVYNVTSTGLSASTNPAALDHIQVNVDLAVPSINIYLNGTDVTSSNFSATISAGTGLVGLPSFADCPAGSIDIALADLFVSMGENIANATLYNGGGPPNPGTKAGGALIGSPGILLGGDMSVADWNARETIGTWAPDTGAGSLTFMAA